MPNHEERELTRINMDVSFVWERSLWDHQITAHAIINAPGIDKKLHARWSTQSISETDADLAVMLPHELDAMWYGLVRQIANVLKEQELWPSFPGLQHENEVKPCPFQAKD